MSYKILLFLFLAVGCSGAQKGGEDDIFIRVNQAGFKSGDIKTAIVFTDSDLSGAKFFVIDKIADAPVFTDRLKKLNTKFGDFKFSYEIDFTDVKDEGKYYIKIKDSVSPQFSINNKVYYGLTADLLKFFSVQRCGYTEPFMHKVCHIADVTSLRIGADTLKKTHDATGGWHDAGDYGKFLNTTAFSTYMLLASYEFAPEKFCMDNNNNNVSDLLEEAKIGLDWLLRADYENKAFITQVQDEKDKTVGWRMPSADPLGFNRPGFVGIGKNLIGVYVAALSIGSRIWDKTLRYKSYSDRLKETAIHFYAMKDDVPDIDSSGTGYYRDADFNGKLALAAIELYQTTGESNYLDDAKKYAEIAGSESWWGWGNMAAFADYKIARYDSSFTDLLRKSLEHYKEHSEKRTFGEGVDLYWGSNMTLLGVSLTNLLYKRLTGDNSFAKLARIHEDYVLGRNQWGISFICCHGERYAAHLHHQIGFFNNGKLPGGFAGGPVMKSVYGNLELKYKTLDSFLKFQTKDAYYRDDFVDYITNEPTISGNATAIFVFGNLK